MRKALWLPLFILPTLTSAQQVMIGRAPPPPVRVMVIESTQTVRFEGDLQQLHARLEINATQQMAWAGYAGSVEAYTKLFFEEKPQTAYPNESAPRQLERMNERLHGRMVALQTIESQARGLYATLSGQQKKMADQHLMASIPVFGFLPPTPSHERIAD